MSGRAKKTANAAAVPSVADKSRRLEMSAEKGKTRERLLAEVAAQGLVVNASTAMRFVQAEFGDLSLTDMVMSLRESGEAINRNDMTVAERMLYAQVVALNAMFGEMARVAHANMFKVPDVADRYMRLALKAQAQSRATVEALAEMKNPRPVAFVKQANIAHGNQQVNYGAPAMAGENYAIRSGAPTHAGKSSIEPNELIEDDSDGGTQLDGGTAQAASGGCAQVEAVGAIHRAT